MLTSRAVKLMKAPRITTWTVAGIAVFATMRQDDVKKSQGNHDPRCLRVGVSARLTHLTFGSGQAIGDPSILRR